MNNSVVCVDASLIIKLVTPEDYSDNAERLWNRWTHEGVVRVAPRLLRYEITSVLRKKAWRQVLTANEADRALEHALKLRVELIDPDELAGRAWQLASRFRQPAAYDSHYLALAELLNCYCWTGDERLFSSVKGGFNQLMWIGENDSMQPKPRELT